MPFKLTASQTVSYNSNVNAIPSAVLPRGRVLCLAILHRQPILVSQPKQTYPGQQLYLDTSFGLIRYLHETGLTPQYTVSAGDNWTLTSRCSGNLGVTLSKSPVEITELVGTGVNYLTTNSLNETAKCSVSNGYSLLFNSSLTNDTNSNPVDAVNNDRTTMLAAGIEYTKDPTTLTALASVSDSELSESRRFEHRFRIG